jgi:glucose-1-phosphate adenylyltransferase
VFRSVLFSICRVHSYSQVNWSVLLPEVEVGRGARLTRVVVDRGVRIPEGLVVGEDPAEDERRFYRSENGIVLITRDMIDRLDAEQAT